MKKIVYYLAAIMTVFCLVSGYKTKAEAAEKYYTLEELGISDYCYYAIKSLKGNKVTYYKTKWADVYHDGTFVMVRTGKYKTAKITPKTKYYAENLKKFNYMGGSMFNQKYIRKVTKKQFFNTKAIDTKNIFKDRYTCVGCHMKLTIKNGKITRIVQYGHVAG